MSVRATRRPKTAQASSPLRTSRSRPSPACATASSTLAPSGRSSVTSASVVASTHATCTRILWPRRSVLRVDALGALDERVDERVRDMAEHRSDDAIEKVRREFVREIELDLAAVLA